MNHSFSLNLPTLFHFSSVTVRMANDTKLGNKMKAANKSNARGIRQQSHHNADHNDAFEMGDYNDTPLTFSSALRMVGDTNYMLVAVLDQHSHWVNQWIRKSIVTPLSRNFVHCFHFSIHAVFYLFSFQWKPHQ